MPFMDIRFLSTLLMKPQRSGLYHLPNKFIKLSGICDPFVESQLYRSGKGTAAAEIKRHEVWQKLREEIRDVSRVVFT